MADQHVAWAAGFLDGEGYFGIRAYTQKEKLRHSPSIEAAQVRTRDPLDRLAGLFGGSVTRRTTGPKAWIWKMDGSTGARIAIPQLLPHLVVKRAEAALVLVLAEMIAPLGDTTELTPEIIEGRELIRQQLLALRRR